MNATVVKKAYATVDGHSWVVSYSQGTLSKLKPPTEDRKTKMITEKMLMNMSRYWYSVARNDSAPAKTEKKMSLIFSTDNTNQHHERKSTFRN